MATTGQQGAEATALRGTRRPTRPNGSGMRYNFESPRLRDSYNQRSRQRDEYRLRGRQAYLRPVYEEDPYRRRPPPVIDAQPRPQSRSSSTSLWRVRRDENPYRLAPIPGPVGYDPDLRETEVVTDVLPWPVRRSSPGEVTVNNYYALHNNPFVLSRLKKSRLSQESSREDTPDPVDDGPTETDQDPDHSSATALKHNVLHSSYTGEPSIGVHNAQITVMPSKPPASHMPQKPIFCWLHFDDKNMDFRNLQTSVGRIPGLADAQRNGLATLLERVRQTLHKPLQSQYSSSAKTALPGVLRETGIPDSDTPKSSPMSITWICLPYFCLERYSPTTHDTKSVTHSLTPLLHMRSSLTTKERELQQAVCSLPNTPPEHCFHVAVLWSLIIDEQLIITCAGAPESTLRGEAISIARPQATQSHDIAYAIIVVWDGHSISWSLPVNECLTWFGFISHFWEYWPLKLDFMFRDESVQPSDWPMLVKKAGKAQIRLILRSNFSETQWGTGLLDTPTGLSSPDPGTGAQIDIVPTANASNVSSDAQARSSDATLGADTLTQVDSSFPTGLHILTWGSSSRSANNAVPSNAEMVQLEGDLKEMDKYLRSSTWIHRRLAYERCTEQSRLDVYHIIAAQRDQIQSSNSSDTTKRDEYLDTVDLVNAADTAFMFFLPSTFEGPTVQQYWGSIYQLVVDHVDTSGDDTAQMKFHRVLSSLKSLNTVIKGYTGPLRHAESLVVNPADFPDELPQSWLQLVMMLIDRDGMNAGIVNVLTAGMEKIVKLISTKSLSEYRIFIPVELASLARLQLMRDVTHGRIDIRDTYEEYFMLLESDIERNPLDRSQQDRIARFKQEVSVILKTLKQQEATLSQQDELSFTMAAMKARPPGQPMGRPGFEAIEHLIVQDSLALVDQRIDSFRALSDAASDLEAWSIQQIDTNKDRQDAAIYVFTVVTIIFLPLSTVAGIMGMNTSDIRNMPYRQWLFWAVSLPLAVIVIVLSLIFAGEWGNFMARLRGTLPKWANRNSGETSPKSSDPQQNQNAQQQQAETKASGAEANGDMETLPRRRPR